MKTSNLFPDTKQPMDKLRFLANVRDEGDLIGARFKCARCGLETGLLIFSSITEAKHGATCEACNTTLS